MKISDTFISIDALDKESRFIQGIQVFEKENIEEEYEKIDQFAIEQFKDYSTCLELCISLYKNGKRLKLKWIIFPFREI